MANRKVTVAIDGRSAGTLEEVDGGVSFTYDARWLDTPGAAPISLTMPLRPEPYPSPTLHPFFLNLLPEGWLLDVSTAELKLSKADPFGLLIALCRDCAGAVEILPGGP